MLFWLQNIFTIIIINLKCIAVYVCVLVPTRVSCGQYNGLLQQDGALCEESDFKDVLFS
jgi:hypothetical protein